MTAHLSCLVSGLIKTPHLFSVFHFVSCNCSVVFEHSNTKLLRRWTSKSKTSLPDWMPVPYNIQTRPADIQLLWRDYARSALRCASHRLLLCCYTRKGSKSDNQMLLFPWVFHWDQKSQWIPGTSFHICFASSRFFGNVRPWKDL